MHVCSSVQGLKSRCCTYDQDAFLPDVVGPAAITLCWAPSQKPAAPPGRADLLQSNIVDAEIDPLLNRLVGSQVNHQAGGRVPQRGHGRFVLPTCHCPDQCMHTVLAVGQCGQHQTAFNCLCRCMEDSSMMPLFEACQMP